MLEKEEKIAFFVSSHGFGHAARAVALMETLLELRPAVQFHIYTEVPRWFFEDTLPRSVFSYHRVATDVGLIQSGPYREDITKTLEALKRLYPLSRSRIAALVRSLHKNGVEVVISDISPVGLGAAHNAGALSILVDNFTWDWIYRGYHREEPRVEEFTGYLKTLLRTADFRFRTEPICGRAIGDGVFNPVSRRSRVPRNVTRSRLGIPSQARMVLVSFGGIKPDRMLERVVRDSVRGRDVWYVLAGFSSRCERCGNMVILPHRNRFYHPDLVAAADVVVGKLGYSTVAEASVSGTGLVYVDRPRFRETAVLSRFVRKHLSVRKLSQEAMERGDWIFAVKEVLREGRTQPLKNGNRDLCSRIVEIIDGV